MYIKIIQEFMGQSHFKACVNTLSEVGCSLTIYFKHSSYNRLDMVLSSTVLPLDFFFFL